MSIIVKKFGGTSVANLDNIRRVAEVIYRAFKRGEKAVIVVSAMAGVTNQLLKWAQGIAPDLSYTQETDVVSSSGEQVTAGLLALTLRSMGLAARSWMGWQLPILTTDAAGEADILSIGLTELQKDLEEGIIPVVAGFQGITAQGRLTTLGRGGSDTTAVALASELKASVCQIFTDVSGVHTVDPVYVRDARRYHAVSYEDMMALAEHGGKVLHTKAVKWAYEHGVLIQVLSSFMEEGPGTWIQPEADRVSGIAQRSVLSWHLPFITPPEAEELSERCQAAGVTFLDWNVSREGLSFLTWRDAQKSVQRLLPKECHGHEMTMITLIGRLPAHPIQDLETNGIPIARYFNFPKVTSIMVENQYVHKALMRLCKVMNLQEAV